MSAIHSKELKTPRNQDKVDNTKAISIAGLIIFAVLWIIGARFTIDGVFWVGNFILSFLRAPIRLTIPPNWSVYLILAPFPFLCDRVEFPFPIERVNNQWKLKSADVVVIWLIISIIDIATTYAGVRNPPNDAWPIITDIASSGILSLIIGIVLTFIPAWFLRRCWRQLWR